MKNIILKRITAFILAVITLMSVSVISFSAQAQESEEKCKYNLFFNTAGSAGASEDRVLVQLIGSKGVSEWCDAGYAGMKGARSTTCKCTAIWCEDVGDVTGIGLKMDGSDDMYVNYVEIAYDHANKRFHGGRWVNTKGITLYQNAEVFRIEIKTADCKNAGTDQDVILNLYDDYGKKLASENLSDIYFDFDAFKRGDVMDFYIYQSGYSTCAVPLVEFELENDLRYMIASGWKIESVSVERVSGVGTGMGRVFRCDHWMKAGDKYTL